MNKIWFGMLFIGFVCCAAGAEGSGGFESLTQEMLASGEDAVYFVIGLVGIMGMWSGFMNIARGSGLIHALARKSRGLMTRLFPREKNEDTLMMMLMGFTANIFGAGNSATVFSLQAMKMLDEENGGSPVASNEMCMFAAVNMSMLQLIPITVIQIRANAGSAAPEDIILPSVISGFAATLVSIFVCKYFEKRDGKRLRDLWLSRPQYEKSLRRAEAASVGKDLRKNGEKQRYKTDAASDKVHGYSEDLCEADGRGGQR